MNRMAQFLRDERGSTTVEFILWIPLFMFFLAATIDASMIYLTQTEMWNVARDTARRISTGQLAPVRADIAEHALGELNVGAISEKQYFIDGSYDADHEAVWVRIGTRIGHASVFGIFAMFEGHQGMLMRSVEATVVMRAPANAIKASTP